MSGDDANANLIMKFSKDDRKAFERIVDKYEKTIFNIAFRIVNDYEDAMDITQTAFMKAYENIDSYNPSHKFFSWLYKITVNESLNHLNKKKRTEKLDNNVAINLESPEEYTAHSEISRRLQYALMKLKFDYRIVVILRHFNSLSYREIGDVLDIPEKTVKSRLFTGRQLLRDILIKQGYKQ